MHREKCTQFASCWYIYGTVPTGFTYILRGYFACTEAITGSILSFPLAYVCILWKDDVFLNVVFRDHLGQQVNIGREIRNKAADKCHQLLNTLRPRQNGHHFADDTFKRIFLNENVIISLKIPLKFVPKGLINNIPALVQIIACRPDGAILNQHWLVNRRIYASMS